MNYKYILTTFLTVAFTFFVVSCKEDQDQKPVDKRFPITFYVSDGTSPIVGAEVSVESLELESLTKKTDESGNATFIGMLPGDYGYAVSAVDYEGISGAVSVVDDAITEDVTLKKDSKVINDKPNVILIMADDMGYECLRSYGGTSYSTPVLDNLAANGVRFNHCYSQPLCTPSRVKIMSGKYNYRNYETFGYLNPDQKTFGNLMKDAGYSTCIAGKWQLNGLSDANDLKDGWDDPTRPYHFGFDEYCLWQLTHEVYNGAGPRRERYANPFIEQNGEVFKFMNGKYGPDVFCDFVTDFMERKKDKPFFIYYPMVLVHDPFVPTPDSPEWAIESERTKEDNKYFSDMMAYTDKIVGRIQDKLKELGLDENTILIFTGDNGTKKTIYSETTFGTIRGGKGKLTDAGTRVPLIVSWPNRALKGEVVDELVSFADFYATLTDLTVQSDSHDGKSFLPIIKGESFEPRKALMINYEGKHPSPDNPSRGRFVRNQRYKLYHDGRFYDILNDPLEKSPKDVSNLSGEELKSWELLNEEHKKFPPF